MTGDGVSRIVLGRVLGAYGIQGWVRVRPFTNDSDGLLSQPVWGLSRADQVRELRVEEAKFHGGAVVARLAGVGDRDAAEALRGADVTVRREQLPPPAAGEYYWADLIGLAVRNESGEELGRVEGLIEAPAHDVLRVRSGDADGRERLIPFVEPIVRAVDVPGGCITVDWQKDY